MRADDPVLHEQMHHITSAARKAVSADKAVLIIEFWDEEKKKDCTMLMYDTVDNGGKEEVVKVVIATLQAIQSMFSATSDLVLTVKNKKTGEVMTIDRHEAYMSEINL